MNVKSKATRLNLAFGLLTLTDLKHVTVIDTFLRFQHVERLFLGILVERQKMYAHSTGDTRKPVAAHIFYWLIHGQSAVDSHQSQHINAFEVLCR